MQRIAQPDHGVSGFTHCGNQFRQLVAYSRRTQPRDQRQPPTLVLRIQLVAQREEILGRHRRAHLACHRIGDAREQFDMRPVQMTGPVTDPGPVRGREHHAVLAVATQLRRLVVQQQRLVGRPHRRLDDRERGRHPPTQMTHHPVRGPITGEHPIRIGTPMHRMRLRTIDEMPTERGKFDAIDRLGGLGPRLRVLAADASDPQHRPVSLHPHRAGEYVEQRYLAGHVRVGRLLRILRAVARLNDGGAALSDGAQQRAQSPDLVGPDQCGQLAEFGTHTFQMCVVLPDRLLYRTSGVEQQ